MLSKNNAQLTGDVVRYPALYQQSNQYIVLYNL